MDNVIKINGLSWETLMQSGWEAYCCAFNGLFPTAPIPLPNEAEKVALLEQTKKLLLQGEGLENRKFRGLAIEFYEGYRATLNLPPGDPSPEVILPWEALVRHLAQFVECADEDEAHEVVDTVGKWRPWATRQLQAAVAQPAVIGSVATA